MEGNEDKLGDGSNRLHFWIAKLAGYLEFKEFGYRPKQGANKGPDHPHVLEQLSFNASIDLILQVHRATILQAHGGGTEIEIAGAQDTIGDGECASTGAGTTVAQAGGKGIQDR